MPYEILTLNGPRTITKVGDTVWVSGDYVKDFIAERKAEGNRITSVVWDYIKDRARISYWKPI